MKIMNSMNFLHTAVCEEWINAAFSLCLRMNNTKKLTTVSTLFSFYSNLYRWNEFSAQITEQTNLQIVNMPVDDKNTFKDSIIWN